ncbi:glycosyltransferase family 4 protein [Winogradskyella costae]|uniref:glycosyltransferase family 4 protein n=1 Tax=Winogradskyella costae TaxID=2697008 RepID=UPI0015CB4BB0|nr:glycosyltransferase family 4 protein [Winogradskyella costae]
MKFLVFHTYNKGYLSSFFHELSAKLVQREHNVVSFSWKGSVSEREKDGVRVIIKRKQGYLVNYRNVYQIIKKEKPDVVLSNFSYANPALLFGKLFGVKKNLVWFHSLNEQLESSKTQIFIKKQFLKLANKVIANSFLTKTELHELYGVQKQKTQAIPFWSNISEQKLMPSELKFKTVSQIIKIGCPGRITDDKNQHIIIETISQLKSENNYDFHLYIAGVGNALSKLKKKVQYLDLIDQVTFLGQLSANEMLTFYNQMDVVVLPSLHEAFGLVFIEAISLGTPVVVSSQFGALSFIKNKNETFSNVTFNPNSVKDLKEKLIPYLEKKGLPKMYFKKLYQDNFNKNMIFKMFLESIEIK